MIRVRKDEWEPVAALLEEEHETAEACAKAVVQLVADLLAKRDGYAVAVPWASGVLLGPIWDDVGTARKLAGMASEAFTATQRAQGQGAVLVPIMSAQGLLRAREEVGPFCGECGHPKPSHWDKTWVKPKGKIRQKPGCVADGCGCREVFVTRKGAWVNPKAKEDPGTNA